MNEHEIPAYFRGYHDAIRHVAIATQKILDGKPDHTESWQEPWASVRRRLLELIECKNDTGCDGSHPVATVWGSFDLGGDS